MGLFLNLLEQRSGTACGDEGSSNAGSALTWILKLGPLFLLFLHRELRFRCLRAGSREACPRSACVSMVPPPQLSFQGQLKDCYNLKEK